MKGKIGVQNPEATLPQLHRAEMLPEVRTCFVPLCLSVSFDLPAFRPEFFRAVVKTSCVFGVCSRLLHHAGPQYSDPAPPV